MNTHCGICGFNEDLPGWNHIYCYCCMRVVPKHIPDNQAKRYIFSYIRKYHNHNPYYPIPSGELDKYSQDIIMNMYVESWRNLR